jgi:hypothetical protein
MTEKTDLVWAGGLQRCQTGNLPISVTQQTATQGLND